MNSATPSRTRMHVLGHSIKPIAAGIVKAGEFDFPSVRRGGTANFNVFYDPAMGEDGAVLSDGVLASCEAEYQTIQQFFNGITPPGLPFNVIIAESVGGAYHYGCGAVDLYCDGQTSASPDVDHTRMLVVAEEVEVFSAAQGAGWDCGASNGEGLSRVLATELYPSELDGFATAAAWLDSPDRPDWVNNNDPTDRDAVANGCSVLFLNYLHNQLGFGWDQIVQAAGATLAETYRRLTGTDDGFQQFSALLQTSFPPGLPSGVTGDNPFPL